SMFWFILKDNSGGKINFFIGIDRIDKKTIIIIG
ncbi:unnamed protein product, partial [marine sediment metagenome]